MRIKNKKRFWFLAWLRFFESVVTILTFTFWSPDWEYRYLNWELTKKFEEVEDD